MVVSHFHSLRSTTNPLFATVLLAAVVAWAGCGSANSLTDTRQYTTRTTNYAVTVSETTKQGHCHKRRITLRSRSGLHRVPVVSKIVALDTNCDMAIDRFRPLTRAEDKKTWTTNRAFIRRDVVEGYYSAVAHQAARR